MTDASSSERVPLTFAQVGEQAGVIEIDLGIYSVPSVLRACYKFSDRAHFLLSRQEGREDRVLIAAGIRGQRTTLSALFEALCNELLDQQLREEIAREVGPLREIIAAHAFAEGDLLEKIQDSSTNPSLAGRPERKL